LVANKNMGLSARDSGGETLAKALGLRPEANRIILSSASLNSAVGRFFPQKSLHCHQSSNSVPQYLFGLGRDMFESIEFEKILDKQRMKSLQKANAER
jgi:hypothetical protein